MPTTYKWIGGARVPVDDGRYNKPEEMLAGFKTHIGYDSLSAEDKGIADKFLAQQDFTQFNPGWFQEYGQKFDEYLSRTRTQQNIEMANKRFKDLTDPNSEYNKEMFNRISRINQPDDYQSSLLYRAMGLGEKSSSFLAESGNKQLQAKANETTYNEFDAAVKGAEASAQGYLGQAESGNLSLLKIMSDQRMQEAQLKQQRELEDSQRKSQLWNSIAKTAIGVGTTLLAPYLLPAIAGSTVADYSFSQGGINRMQNYDSGLRF